MNKAWLLAYDIWDSPDDFMIAVDETDALETYMSLVEQDLYEEFYMICMDEFEDPDQNWNYVARWQVKFGHTLWNVMEVPIIYGDSGC